MSQFAVSDVETLDYPFQIGPCCPTSPVTIDTWTLDWAFQIGPFVAYQDAVNQPVLWVAMA